MMCTITIERSDTWIAAERLARGANVPQRIDMPIDVAKLTIAARKILLAAGAGSYPEKFSGRFGSDYTFCDSYSYYGSEPLLIDSDAPSYALVSAAIVDAAERLAEKKRLHDEDSAAQAAARVRAEEEKRIAAERLARARELLADELAKIPTLMTRLDIVSMFLANMPEDALRGALKAQAQDANAIEALRERVENASTFAVFTDDE